MEFVGLTLHDWLKQPTSVARFSDGIEVWPAYPDHVSFGVVQWKQGVATKWGESLTLVNDSGPSIH